MDPHADGLWARYHYVGGRTPGEENRNQDHHPTWLRGLDVSIRGDSHNTRNNQGGGGGFGMITLL